MTTTSPVGADTIERTYSAGQKPRTEGLFGMSWVATLTAGAVVVTTITAQLLGGLLVALVVLAVGVCAAAPLVITIGGRPGYVHAMLFWQWRRGVRRGGVIYRSGSFSRIPGGRTPLPGLLAPTQLYEGSATTGHRFGLIHLPRFDQYTVVLKCWPQGGEAVDQPLVDAWVAAWGTFIASLGGQPDIAAIVPVIDTMPETGNRLMAEVQTITRPAAPEITRQVLWELGGQLARERVQLDARLAITFVATTPERRKIPAEQALEVGRRLPGILTALEEAGVRARPMLADEITAFTRRSYDPASQAELEAAATDPAGHGLTWADAGPTDHDDKYDHYRHSGAKSITWEMTRAPEGVVRERVLERLLEPNPDVPRKRVAIVYRPHSAADGTKLVDDDFRDARVAEQSGKRGIVSASAGIRVEETAQARQEQARGHGLTRYGVLITITAPHAEDVAPIEALTADLSVQARLAIRRCYRYQGAAFAASLGLGVLLPEQATVAKFMEG